MSPEAGPGDARNGPVPSYASTKLIAYIGNKRALLPSLRAVFVELEGRSGIGSFLDPFAGTGSVSRLARCLGYRVMANDAEEYSLTVNACWLGIPAEACGELFAGEGGIEAVFSRVNRFHPEREDELPGGVPVEPYIARHYAPADTARADWRRERLFYTRENAVFLDRARSFIEDYRPRPAEGGAEADQRSHNAVLERAILLGPLVYEAATHVNTSGVFKAFHKGFGGHGRDALGRIMGPMALEPPELWPGEGAELGRGDAAAFCAGRSADLCYLDPPYNQHQYGSNYHLLNTIARWDGSAISEERSAEGELAEKAGIPPRWRETRSAFCSRTGAAGAFRGLFEAVDARFIVLSYNSEAILPPDELYDLLARHAEVEMRSMEYVTYPGGRQSATRGIRNRELLFIARRLSETRRSGMPDCGPVGKAPPEARAGERESRISDLRAELRLARVLSCAFDPARLGPLADEAGCVTFRREGLELSLPSYRLLAIEMAASDLCAGLDADAKNALADLLEPAVLRDNGAACEACIALLESGCAERRVQALALRRLRKIAHRKYGPVFEACAGRLEAAARKGGLEKLAISVAGLRAIYELRLSSSPRARGP